jgi:hypothetical protein
MPILQIEHAVGDYETWKEAFDSDPVGRERGGVRRYRIARPTDDPSYVVVDLEFDGIGEAEAFLTALRALWDSAGPRLGLENPRARIVESVESKEY